MSDRSKHKITRRDFVKVATTSIGGMMTALMGLPIIGYLFSPALRAEGSLDNVISLGPLDNYPIDIPTPFNFTRKKVNGWEKTVVPIGMFVVRKKDGSVRVFSDICTHLGCIVSWHPDIQEYVSPCHDGHFDVDGFVTKGPPPRPLDEFQTKIENGVLYAVFPSYKRSS